VLTKRSDRSSSTPAPWARTSVVAVSGQGAAGSPSQPSCSVDTTVGCRWGGRHGGSGGASDMGDPCRCAARAAPTASVMVVRTGGRTLGSRPLGDSSSAGEEGSGGAAGGGARRRGRRSECAARGVAAGGHRTVCEALGGGVPLIVVPITGDQPIVAQQVARASAPKARGRARAGVRRRHGCLGPRHIPRGWRSRQRGRCSPV
jgi:hypothetical protein